MRAQLTTLAVAISLIATLGSLVGNQSAALPSFEGCCICLDCGITNATTSGFGADDAICSAASNSTECDGICENLACSGSDFENVTCSDPSLGSVCADQSTMAPAASPAILVVLIGLLAGFGAFYLRRRSA